VARSSDVINNLKAWRGVYKKALDSLAIMSNFSYVILPRFLSINIKSLPSYLSVAIEQRG